MEPIVISSTDSGSSDWDIDQYSPYNGSFVRDSATSAPSSSVLPVISSTDSESSDWDIDHYRPYNGSFVRDSATSAPSSSVLPIISSTDSESSDWDIDHYRPYNGSFVRGSATSAPSSSVLPIISSTDSESSDWDIDQCRTYNESFVRDSDISVPSSSVLPVISSTDSESSDWDIDQCRTYNESFVRDSATSAPSSSVLPTLASSSVTSNAASLIDGKPIINLSPKTINLSPIDFSPEERSFYEKLEAKSRSRFKVSNAMALKEQVDSYTIPGSLITIRTGDHVLVHNETNSRDWIACVQEYPLKEEKKIRIKWFYWPEDLPMKKKNYFFFGVDELIDSVHIEDIEVDSLKGKCIVHKMRTYIDKKQVSPRFCKCDKNTMVQCAGSCKKWFHTVCVGLDSSSKSFLCEKCIFNVDDQRKRKAPVTRKVMCFYQTYIQNFVWLLSIKNL